MATPSTTATAQKIAKTAYGKIRDLRPDITKAPLQHRIGFSEKDKLGEKFSETIWLSDLAGYTYGGNSSDLFALNDAHTGDSREVYSDGCEIVLREQVSIKRLTTAMSAGPKAFENMWTRLLANMTNGMGKRVDISHMYGGDNIGVVTGTPSGSSGARVMTLTAASWLPLAWLGAKNARIDVYSSGGTHRNPTTDIVVTAVTPDKVAPTVAISGLEAEIANIANTDVIYFKGAKDNECDGVTKIAGLTGSETYLNMAANAYPDLWSGNPEAVGGTFSFAKLEDAIMKSQARGGGFGRYVFMCAHATWTTLSGDMNALRAIDSGYRTETTDYGQRRLRFYCGDSEVEIAATLNMKQGEAVLFPISDDADVKRLGSSDVSFVVPGIGERYYHILENDHGVEARCYSDQFVWTTAINSFIHFTGITH